MHTIKRISIRTGEIISITPFINEVMIDNDNDINSPLALGSLVVSTLIHAYSNDIISTEGWNSGYSAGIRDANNPNAPQKSFKP